MKPATCSLLSVVASAIIVAAILTVTAPSPPEGTLSVSALALPRSAVAGERVEAYAAVVNSMSVTVHYMFGACVEDDCRTSPGNAVPPVTEWHGFAGALEPMTRGPKQVAWFMLDAAEEASSGATAMLIVDIHVLDPESARDAEH